MGRRALDMSLVVGALLASSGGAAGQRTDSGAFAGFSFVAADAMSDFGLLVDKGFGLQLEGGLPMTEDGLLRLRADMGFVIYGIESQYICYGVSCRVGSDLTTTNSIFYGGIGPELAIRRGGIEPYVHATAGLSAFVTRSTLDDDDAYGPYLGTTNHSDVVFAWKLGGGLRFRVGGARVPIFLDLGVERHDNGIAEFLTVGDIVDHADGSITINPNRGEANLTTFRFGLTFAIPRGDDADERR